MRLHTALWVMIALCFAALAVAACQHVEARPPLKINGGMLCQPNDAGQFFCSIQAWEVVEDE